MPPSVRVSGLSTDPPRPTAPPADAEALVLRYSVRLELPAPAPSHIRPPQRRPRTGARCAPSDANALAQPGTPERPTRTRTGRSGSSTGLRQRPAPAQRAEHAREPLPQRGLRARPDERPLPGKAVQVPVDEQVLGPHRVGDQRRFSGELLDPAEVGV